METLRSELKKLVQGSVELVSRNETLQVPSWRFPEKLAVTLDLEGILNNTKCDINHLMELIIDRLLLLLQCCICQLEDKSVSGIPLTLGSVAKRLSKCVIKQNTAVADLKEQVSLKNKQLLSLESSFMKLQQEYKDFHQEHGTTPETLYHFENSHHYNDSSTQTTETAFSLCDQCSAMQLVLANAASLFASLCCRNKLKSHFSSCDWSKLARVGSLNSLCWSKAIEFDLKTLDESLQEKSSCQAELQSSIVLLKNDISSLVTKNNALQIYIKETQENNNLKLSSTLAYMERNQAELKSKNVELKTKLDFDQQALTNLNVIVTELKAYQEKLEEDLYAARSQEFQLKLGKQDLEKQLQSVIEQSQRVYSDGQIELSKEKIHSKSLEKKNKDMRAKQTTLLSRIDELDEECLCLKEELKQKEIDCVTMSKKYTHIKGQLTIEESKLYESIKQKERLSAEIALLQAEVINIKDQLNIEKKNCRLLMDYPFVKETEAAKASWDFSVVHKQSQKQIAANTVRILLLEEQNKKLREKIIEETEESGYHNESKGSYPVHLWKTGLVSSLQEEVKFNRGNLVPPCTEGEKTEESQKTDVLLTLANRATKSKLKGRLGHLFTAITDAHQDASFNNLASQCTILKDTDQVT